MRRATLTLALLAFLGGALPVQAESLWQRRHPYTAYLFMDTRARQVGDVLTIVVREATLFDGKEDRKLNKEHKSTGLWSLGGFFSAGESTHSFSGQLEGEASSQKKLNGKADYKSDRTFLDRTSVVVVGVLPNGNLLIEEYRERVVANEKKLLHVSGIVRPMDIGAGNVIQSQYIANLVVSYTGRGVETRYTNPGWLGRIAERRPSWLGRSTT